MTKHDDAALTRGGLLKVDPVPLLASSNNVAITLFARRDLLGVSAEPVSTLWELPDAQRIVAKQRSDGSWHYPGGKSGAGSREKYDQLETFRQAGTLVEKFGFRREHPSIQRAARFLFYSRLRPETSEASTATSSQQLTSARSWRC
jgi:hypothetical protein